MIVSLLIIILPVELVIKTVAKADVLDLSYSWFANSLVIKQVYDTRLEPITRALYFGAALAVV